MGIVAAAGSLADFVLRAAKPELPADGPALTGFVSGQREKLAMSTLQPAYEPLSTAPFNLIMSKLHPK